MRYEPREEDDEDSAQQKPQPVEQKTEVIADSGEHGVDGAASGMSEIIAAHAVLGLKMTDHRLDSRTPFHVALDLRGDATLLAGSVDLEVVIERRIVPALSGTVLAAEATTNSYVQAHPTDSMGLSGTDASVPTS